MTTTPRTHAYEMCRVAALEVAVRALEMANEAEADDPITAHQFRSILATARKIVARMDICIAAVSGEAPNA